MVFYFTATGNSLYVSKQLDPLVISIAQAIHDTDKHYKDERIGIVCPIYGHEMPELVKEFIQSSTFETDYFYVVLTYGNRHGGASELAQSFFKEQGLDPSYINVILMVDNYLPVFDMEEQIKIDKHVDEQIKQIKEDIDARKKMISSVTDEDHRVHQMYLDIVASHPKDMYKKLYVITDSCIGCSICEKICPKGCFHVKDQRSYWNGQECITCMACIHACPTKAIQMTISEKNPHARYRNENITLCEIVEANDQKK